MNPETKQNLLRRIKRVDEELASLEKHESIEEDLEGRLLEDCRGFLKVVRQSINKREE